VVETIVTQFAMSNSSSRTGAQQHPHIIVVAMAGVQFINQTGFDDLQLLVHMIGGFFYCVKSLKKT
jgi:hypothetical protein